MASEETRPSSPPTKPGDAVLSSVDAHPATASGDGTTSQTGSFHAPRHKSQKVWLLALSALGVVYGDIGTSPLYALRECWNGTGIEPSPGNVMGLLSLFFWSMTLVVTVKYVLFITKADNEGEGGILALLALVLPRRGPPRLPILITAGLFGAALLYADGMLTPAISVLSAVEGFKGFATFIDNRVVVAVSVAILFSLFWLQERGTARVGMMFGPIMMAWFFALAVSGIYWIVRHPGVLVALSPHHAAQFFLTNRASAFWVLGSVVLCVTGGEALYADMGHFGRRPIGLSWTALVWPALTLNYFGQGALLLEFPHLHEDSFFAMFGESTLRIPMVILATFATVIASQALISGAFSITRQAIQLGYLPRLEILHTASDQEGQIYVPGINWLLMTACIALVLVFQSSSAMAAAYGIAVTGTMSITTILFFVVTQRWWGTLRAGVVCSVLLAVDLAFFFANFVKIASGGWIPLAVAMVILAVMTTWKIGRERVGKFLKDRSEPLDEFLEEVDQKHPVRVPGTAVFMTSTMAGTPPVLLHHFKHNKTLHEQVVLLSIVTDDVPYVPQKKRVNVDKKREGFFLVSAHYGFMEVPKVTSILKACQRAGLHTERDSTSFYLGREKLKITADKGMAHWRKVLFALLSMNARPATDFFEIPHDRVVEIGMQLKL